MDTPLIQAHVKELQGQVKPYSKVKTGSYMSSFSISLKNFYYIIPVTILVILLIWRPNFLYNENGDEQGNVTKKLSFKKVLIWWLVLSLLSVMGLFGYNYKRSKQN